MELTIISCQDITQDLLGQSVKIKKMKKRNIDRKATILRGNLLTTLFYWKSNPLPDTHRSSPLKYVVDFLAALSQTVTAAAIVVYNSSMSSIGIVQKVFCLCRWKSFFRVCPTKGPLPLKATIWHRSANSDKIRIT